METSSRALNDIPLHEALRQRARDTPDKAAYFWYGRAVTFAELDRASDAFAARLAALGVKKGEPVALYMNNCPQYAMAHYGIQKLGAIVCPCSPLNKHRRSALCWLSGMKVSRDATARPTSFARGP